MLCPTQPSYNFPESLHLRYVFAGSSDARSVFFDFGTSSVYVIRQMTIALQLVSYFCLHVRALDAGDN